MEESWIRNDYTWKYLVLNEIDSNHNSCNLRKTEYYKRSYLRMYFDKGIASYSCHDGFEKTSFPEGQQ